MKNGNRRLELNPRAAMRPYDLESMSTDELSTLHEKIAVTLSEKLAAEKTCLEKRLRQLGVHSKGNSKNVGHARRPYPRVLSKFRNPDVPSQTWAGRGKQPLWLKAQLKSGRAIDDFRIDVTTAQASE